MYAWTNLIFGALLAVLHLAVLLHWTNSRRKNHVPLLDAGALIIAYLYSNSIAWIFLGIRTVKIFAGRHNAGATLSEGDRVLTFLGCGIYLVPAAFLFVGYFYIARSNIKNLGIDADSATAKGN